MCYQFHEDGLAFNKAGMSRETAYEIIPVAKSMDDYRIPQNCRLITKERASELNCEIYSEIYRCEGVERYITAREELRDPSLLRLAQLGRLSTDIVVNGTRMNYEDLSSQSEMISRVALQKMGIPEAYRIFGNPYRKLITDTYNNGYPAEEGLTEEDLYSTFAWIFMRAAPDMHDEFYSDIQKNAIKLFRESEIYSKLSPMDRLIWGGAYENANSVKSQFDIATNP